MSLPLECSVKIMRDKRNGEISLHCDDQALLDLLRDSNHVYQVTHITDGHRMEFDCALVIVRVYGPTRKVRT